jgi:AraC-like DNA-binding protein
MPPEAQVPEWFGPFSRAYWEAFQFDLLYTDAGGHVLAGEALAGACRCGGANAGRRCEAASQTLYWGETIINLCCDDGSAMWAVPVLHNNNITANLAVQGIDLEAGGRELSQRVQKAADALLAWAIRDNLVAEAVVKLARQRAKAAADRFRSLEQAKHFGVDDLRCLYLREEPELLSAIKYGARAEARAILNRILVNIYGLGSQRMDLLKSMVLELIVMMSRAAVEAGASPSVLLGANYRSIAELSQISDEEDLARWVRRMLDSLIEAIRINEDYPHSLILAKALSFMRENLGRNLRRSEVARHAGVSPGHLAHVMTERLGRSFTDMLAKMRVDRAKELLRSGNLSLSAIAVDCGFYDQSHLNKIFRKLTGKSPGAFRTEGRG